MKGRRVVLFLGIVSSVFAAIAPLAGAANQAVTVSNNLYTPASVTVLPNETVTWNNTGGQHNVAFDDGSFVDPPAPSTELWTSSRTFTTPGTYRYYCQAHGGPNGIGMSAEVVVSDPGPTDADPPTSSASAPASSRSASFVITYTASDGTGSGVADVELWGKGPGDTEFFLEDTHTTPDSPSFNYTAPLGNGTYEFYTRATDNAGNYEDAPATPDSTTVLNIPDIDPPTSSASAPATSASNFFTITYTASDGTGSSVVEVELWGKGPGESAYVLEDFDATPESPTFNYVATVGDGTYEFFTRAIGSAGNYEEAPFSPDTTTVVNTAAAPQPITTPPAPAPIATAGAPRLRFTRLESVPRAGPFGPVGRNADWGAR
jgi:plastocyanin